MTDQLMIEIPTIPRPGEIWLTVNLNLIEDIANVFQVAKDLGFNPRLGCRQVADCIEVHAILHHERRNLLRTSIWGEFEREMVALSDAVNPDALHLMSALTRRVA